MTYWAAFAAKNNICECCVFITARVDIEIEEPYCPVRVAEQWLCDLCVNSPLNVNKYQPAAAASTTSHLYSLEIGKNLTNFQSVN